MLVTYAAYNIINLSIFIYYNMNNIHSYGYL